ncbi:MAG: NAD(P)-dependent oxidoreductase [Candidatus Promineifilaceae bacterium]
MTILIAGASGATGRLLVEQLLNRGQQVRAIVRSPERLPDHLRNDANLSIITASILNLSDAEMAQHVQGCHAVASCLGHNLSFKGLFGQPRKLVTDATRRLCDAIKANQSASHTKFVLMNTAGNRNRDLLEPISSAEKGVVGLLRLLLPPHSDNEAAADYLRTQIGSQDPAVQWVAVRPDGLINQADVTDYTVHPSPIRSAIFNPGVTSRINVGAFMAELITNADLWAQWQGQMPVIYNNPTSNNEDSKR